jgi:hypothetical protein
MTSRRRGRYVDRASWKKSTSGIALSGPSAASEGKNQDGRQADILVIWGDDIGIANLSCYTRGLMGAIPHAFAAMTVDAYQASALAFMESAKHPTLKRPYRTCGYVPMVELLRYLEANGFTPYIASGGDRDFMRSVAWELYGIPPERVIGSTQAIEYQERDDGTDVLYKAQMEFFDDGPEKPVRIWSRIGRRPLIAGGNSNGGVPMLRFARTPARPALRLLLLHDDKVREFDYVAGAEAALERAKTQRWTVISIKNDWATVFADV